MASITLDEALAAINAAVRKARELNAPVGISVVDDRGDVIASVQMDGVRFGFLPDISRGKAFATVIWGGQPSGALAERAGNPVFSWVQDYYHGKAVYAKGAVPVKRGDKLIGAVGAGGSSQENDEAIAQAGADAIR
ncbi:MAG: heme-binding protein [SAR202 cluster bacterium]|nr:heme-binding protein [SAR202 cluster bacterium]